MQHLRRQESFCAERHLRVKSFEVETDREHGANEDANDLGEVLDRVFEDRRYLF